MPAKPPNPFISPIVHEIRRYDSNQRRKLRQLCFWILFTYLSVTWYGKTALTVAAALASVAVIVFLANASALRRRPTFILLHGSICVLMIAGLLRRPDLSRQLVTLVAVFDFGALGALVALELNHAKTSLLLAIGIEHVLGLATNPVTSVRLMADPALPEVGVVALLRIFAIMMVAALYVRLLTERFAPSPLPSTVSAEQQSRKRPLTAAEWDAEARK